MSLIPDSSFVCPRLIDYIIIVGSKNPNFELQTLSDPELLCKFPKQNHTDFPIQEECVYFCQPDGCVLTNYQNDISSFIFTLTDKDLGRTRYGICLNYYRKTEKDPSYGIMTSLCLISHHPYFSRFRELLYLLKNLIMNSQKMLEKLNINQDILDVLCEFEDPSCNIVHEMIDSIQIWIYKLLSAPIPIPGKTCLNIIPTPDATNFLTFASPDKTRLTLIDFPLHLPLELLGVEACMHALSAVMLEQKVVLQSRDYNSLTMCIMALTNLLYPLQYMFPIIPLLPTSLRGAEQILCSPTPFIIGIPSSFLQAKSEFRLPIDVWLIDIDSNRIICSQHMEPLPPLPQPESRELIENLKKILSELKDKSENPYNSDNEKDIDCADVATRVAMVKFFDSHNVLANFTEHTRTIRLYPRPVVAFQQQSYIRSRSNISSFTKRLIFTQAVEYLSEWSLCPENEVFQRIHTGISDPKLIGDKVKWYYENLLKIQYDLCQPGSPVLTDESCKSFQIDISTQIDSLFETFDPKTWISLAFKFGSQEQNIDQTIDLLKRQIKFFTSEHKVQSRVWSNDWKMYLNPRLTYQEVKEEARRLAREADMRRFSISTRGSFSGSISRQLSQNSSVEDVQEASERRKPALRHINRWDSKLKSIKYQNDTYEDEDENPPQSLNWSSRTEHGKHISSGSEDNSDQDDSDIWDLKIKTTIEQESVKTPQPKPPDTKPISNTTLRFSFERTPKATGEEFTFNDSEYKEKTNPTISENKDEPDEDEMEEASVAKHILSKFQDETKSAKSTISGLIDNRKELAKKVVENVKERTSKPIERIINSTEIVDSSNKSGAPKSLIIGGKRLSLNMNQSGIPNIKMSDNAGLMRQSTTDKSFSDQQFLRETVQQVLLGQNIGLRAKGRLRTLMDDENYRNYVLAKLNVHTSGVNLITQDSYLEDVQLPNKNVFKNFVWLILTIVRGLENSFANRAVGGMSSALMTLEIAHTHFMDPNQSFLVKSDQNLDTQLTTSSDKKMENTTNVEGNETQGPEGDNMISQFTSWFKSATKDIKNKQKPLLDKGVESSKKLIQKSQEVGEASRESLSKIVDRPQDTARNLANGISELLAKASANIQTNSPQSETDLKEVSITNLQISKTTEDLVMPKSRISGSNRFSKGKLLKCITVPEKFLERQYLFEALVVPKDRSKCWDNMFLWEDAFLDSVAQERDIIGLDQAPMEMLERYANLGPSDRKRLELDEDRLLATLLHNLVSFMLMMNVDKQEITTNVRRIMARCRIGQYFSHMITVLLESLPYLIGNSIDLFPLMSLTMPKKSFTVHLENDTKPFFIEVYYDRILMRNLSGAITDRLFYDKLLNMTFCPTNRLLCLWRADTNVESTSVNVLKVQSRECKKLYSAIKTSMNRLAETKNIVQTGVNFDTEYEAELLSSGTKGTISVNMSGIQFTGENSEFLMAWDLQRIKRCFTESINIFVIEEFDPESHEEILHHFQSEKASEIAYSVLSFFSCNAVSGGRFNGTVTLSNE